MNTARTLLAIAELAATLTTDFDVPMVLHEVARHARECFDAFSAVVILLDHGHTAGQDGIQIVGEAVQEGHWLDPRLHTTGPGLVSARDDAVAMIGDLVEEADNARWPHYRQSGDGGYAGCACVPGPRVGCAARCVGDPYR
jgi:hypothetical protein